MILISQAQQTVLAISSCLIYLITITGAVNRKILRLKALKEYFQRCQEQDQWAVLLQLYMKA